MATGTSSVLLTVHKEPQINNVAQNHSWLRNFAISEIFFRIFRTYSPFVGEVLQTIWNCFREFYHFCHVQVLNAAIQGLQSKVYSLSIQVRHLAIGSEALRLEKEQANQERDAARHERAEFVLSRAPILISRDGLAKENLELKLKIQQLEKAVANRDELQGEYNRVVQELGMTKAQLERSQHAQDLNQHLSVLQQQLQRINQDGGDEVTQMALQTLAPAAKEHKEKFHETLRTAIGAMDPTDPATVSLNGILRVSEDEVNHLEWISKIFGLLEQLRQPLNSCIVTTQTYNIAVEV